ncbi:MAG: hypothetical protein DMG38_19815 [Acidobacteria bacterium]|nr:MAG: hypothetical protein DMG38_19815 [Acidobacteriota bacterium]
MVAGAAGFNTECTEDKENAEKTEKKNITQRRREHRAPQRGVTCQVRISGMMAWRFCEENR